VSFNEPRHEVAFLYVITAVFPLFNHPVWPRQYHSEAYEMAYEMACGTYFMWLAGRTSDYKFIRLVLIGIGPQQLAKIINKTFDLSVK